MEETGAEKEILNNERYEALRQIEDWLEAPLIVLGFVWLGILCGGGEN